MRPKPTELSDGGRGRTQVQVMVVVGTRPEAIKMAPVVRAFQEDPRFSLTTVVTGQHRDMLDQVLTTFGITPDHDLDVMRHGQSLTDVTVRILEGLKPVLDSMQPEILLVHGDTLTAFTAALAGFFQQIPVGHVEAGLRTYQRYDPFPEEMNRKLLGSLATLHFAPTMAAKEHLLKENIDLEHIFVTGNTVIDALLLQVSADYMFEDAKLSALDAGGLFKNKRVIVATTHRRENLGAPMQRIFNALLQIVDQAEDVEVVFPVHQNRLIKEQAEAVFNGHPHIHLVQAQSYRCFANLMARSTLVMTDSGGIQEEAPALGKPVFVLRETTERPEGIAAGTCRLVGTDTVKIVSEVLNLLQNPDEYNKMARAVNPYGDGNASNRIKQAIEYIFQLGSNPPADWERRGQ